MTLPSSFYFKFPNVSIICTAEYFDGSYVVSWGAKTTNEKCIYDKRVAVENVKSGRWIIHAEPKPESELVKTSLELCNFIHDKKDASKLISGELEALHLLRRLITRLLDDRS